jgi:hypothetical protein
LKAYRFASKIFQLGLRILTPYSERVVVPEQFLLQSSITHSPSPKEKQNLIFHADNEPFGIVFHYFFIYSYSTFGGFVIGEDEMVTTNYNTHTHISHCHC